MHDGRLHGVKVRLGGAQAVCQHILILPFLHDMPSSQALYATATGYRHKLPWLFLEMRARLLDDETSLHAWPSALRDVPG